MAEDAEVGASEPIDPAVEGSSEAYEQALNLAEIEALGAGRLSPGAAAYFAGAAADEITMADNIAAFRRWRFVPRVMVPIAERDPTVEMLGRRWPQPFMVAPMALMRLGHPDGEVAVARAAADRGLVMSLSTVGSATIEEVAATGARLWFQLYLLRDRARSVELLDRAAAAGCEAVILTLDTPIVGLRERDRRTGFALPPGVAYELVRRPGLQRGDAYGEDVLLDSYSWDDVDWTVARTSLPVVAKGVLHPADARLALEHGAAAVVVSNHGGRQLDLSIAALDALPAVVDEIAGAAPVILDGGVRRGTDVLMAVALGARAVMVGRPLLMALPLGGAAAVGHALDLLAFEVDRGLALSGVPHAADLRRGLLVRAGAIRAGSAETMGASADPMGEHGPDMDDKQADQAGLTLDEVAYRVDAERAYVEGLVGAGVLAPGATGLFTQRSVRRVRLVQLLQDAGIALEAIAAAVRSDLLVFEGVEMAMFDHLVSYAEETFAQVAERTGIPEDVLMVIRDASGSAAPAPDDRMREDELRVVPLIELQLAEGLRPVVVERALRVYGESLRRMAETEGDWWRSDLVAPRLARGGTWTDIANLANELSPRLIARSDEAVMAMYRAQQTNAWMRNVIEGVEALLAAVGLHSPPQRSDPAICFLDLTGYTRLTEEHGDEAAAATAERLARMVEGSSRQHGGKPVKWLGDGVMFHFPEPAQGVLAALDMVVGAGGAGLPPAHVGLHAGPVLYQEGDYFGRTVNAASRIADYARPGEVLVSQQVVELAARPEVRFSEIGPVELKGLTGPLRLHVASRAR